MAACSDIASGSADYRHIAVTPSSGALGAEVAGVDLGEPLDQPAFDELRRAFHAHLVLFFRDQHLTPEAQVAFISRFGRPFVHPHMPGIKGHPEILEIRKEAHETYNFGGGGWHCDVSYLDPPALGSMLYALDVPDHRGDTLFANQHLAYDALSDGMKAMLDGLRAVHSYEGADPSVTHPVVRTHRQTGRKALYVNGMFTRRFADMTADESARLLGYLYRHAVRPEFTCRFAWRRGSVAFWDNRCTQHYPINDYDGHRREMRRVTVMCGDGP